MDPRLPGRICPVPVGKSESLTDIQRAVRFYYLLRNGYSARIPKPTFNISTLKRSNFNLLRLEEELSLAHLRLSRTYIENLEYQACIERFDRPHTFFYLDPPYYGCEDYYGKGLFSRADYLRLATILAHLRGKFIMSINNPPEIRDIYRQFAIVEVKTVYQTAAGRRRKPVTELLIMNFDPPG